MDVREIRRQAQKELNDELFRKAVDEYKLKLKNRRSLLDRIFPYKVVLIKKGA